MARHLEGGQTVEAPAEVAPSRGTVEGSFLDSDDVAPFEQTA